MEATFVNPMAFRKAKLHTSLAFQSAIGLKPFQNEIYNLKNLLRRQKRNGIELFPLKNINHLDTFMKRRRWENFSHLIMGIC